MEIIVLFPHLLHPLPEVYQFVPFGSQTYLKSTRLHHSSTFQLLQFACFYPGLSTIHSATLSSDSQMPSPCTFQSLCPRALPLEPITGLCPPCLPCSRHADLLSRPLIPQTTGVLLQSFCKCYSTRMLFFFARPAPSLPVISERSSLTSIPKADSPFRVLGWGRGKAGCWASKVDRYVGWIISQIGVGQV